MRRPAFVSLLSLAALAACSEGAPDPSTPLRPSFRGAGSPHFIASSTGAEVNPDPSLHVFFKEAGVGSGATVTIRAAARANLVLACVNGGDNQPTDKKKHAISTNVSQSGQFTANAGGNVVASHTLPFPASTSLLSCPSGQVSTLLSGFWDQVGVFDDTNGQSLAIPGKFPVGQ